MTIRKDVKYQALVHYEYFEKSLRTVAGKYGISKSILSKWLKHKSKPCVPTTQNARPNSLVNRIQDQVERVVQYDPYVSASEIRSKLSVNVARSVSLSTVYRALHAKRITYKRAQRCPKGSPPSSHPFMQVPDPYENAISIDECHFYTSDRRRRGWAKKGWRVPKEPLRGRTSTTLLLAIDHSGVVGYTLKTGSVKAGDFADFIKTLPPGRPIILDNAAIHRSRVVRETAQRHGSNLRFIPPYSPWFNPIEFAFSEVKRSVRRLITANTLRELYKVLRARLLLGVASASYFNHCKRVRREFDQAPNSA